MINRDEIHICRGEIARPKMNGGYKMMQILLIILGLLLTMGGVVMVYDARILTYRFFSFGDQNEASLGMKMLGFIIITIGAFIVYFNM